MPAPRPWMFVRQLETLEDPGLPAVLDRLEAGGIRGLVLGDLWFRDGTPGFAPDPALYAGLEKQPPSLSPGGEARARVVREAVLLARARGFAVYLHDWGHGGGGQGMNDPQSTAYAAARTRDALARLPGLAGLITDGPEWGYEIEPGNRQEMFRPFTPFDRARAGEWGFDADACEAGAAAFRQDLRRLRPEDAERAPAAAPGLFDGADYFMANPGFLEWLRFRERSLREWVGSLRAAARSADPSVRVACGPRTAAFAPLAGYNLRLLRDVTEFLCPKLYFWAGGFDGFKGTLCRWARTLAAWNPGLGEPAALAVACRLFGLDLPGIRTPEELERPLDRRCFEAVVSGEIARAAARAGDAACLCPWVGLHHGGIRLAARELEWMLEAIAASPLERFIYWHYEDMRPEEWELLRRLGG